jgi:hypothetical protein
LIVGVLGASTALAGLLVVFEGFLITAYATWPPGADLDQRKQYRIGVVAAAAGVVLAVGVALLSTLGLLGLDLFGLLVGGFILLLIFVIAIAIAATRLALE